MSTTVTLRPTTVLQAGTGVTLTGGTNIATMLSDNLDTSFISINSKCRLPTQVVSLGFTAPTIPSGAQIVSVTLRQRSLSVTTGQPRPRHCHWFRCNDYRGQNFVTTIIEDIFKDFHPHQHPQTTTATWTTETVFSSPTDPLGNPWTSASFTNGFALDIGRDDDAGGAMEISEVYLDVVYQQQAAITVTAPTGTVTASGTPTVIWAYTQGDSLPQVASRTAIYTAAQVAGLGFVPFVTAPVQQSGWVTGDQGEALQWIIPQALVNGGWSAYVQVKQKWDGTTDFTSAIASTSWTQSVAGCPDPVLSSAVFDAVHNRVRLTVVPASSSPVTAVFQAFRSDDNGLTFNLIRFGTNVTANGMTPVTIDDYEAPLNKPAQYKVLAYGVTSGVFFPSAHYSATLTVTPATGNAWWLKDPINPLGNTVLPVATLGDKVTQQKNYGVFDTIGGGTTTYKVVVEGSRFGLEGTLDLMCHVNQAQDYWAAFDALDSSGHTLLLQYPTGEQHFVRLVPGEQGSDKSWTWDMTFTSDEVKYRKAQVSYVEVRPVAVTT